MNRYNPYFQTGELDGIFDTVKNVATNVVKTVNTTTKTATNVAKTASDVAKTAQQVAGGNVNLSNLTGDLQGIVNTAAKNAFLSVWPEAEKKINTLAKGYEDKYAKELKKWQAIAFIFMAITTASSLVVLKEKFGKKGRKND